MAFIPVPNWYPMLRGNERYNPLVSSSIARPWDGAHVVTGMMKPDSPEGVKADPPLPELPFRFIIPCVGLDDGDWHVINTTIFYRLQRGESLMDLDFTPPPPRKPQPQQSGNGLLVFGGLVLATLVVGAFFSKN